MIDHPAVANYTKCMDNSKLGMRGWEPRAGKVRVCISLSDDKTVFIYRRVSQLHTACCAVYLGYPINSIGPPGAQSILVIPVSPDPPGSLPLRNHVVVAVTIEFSGHNSSLAHCVKYTSSHLSHTTLYTNLKEH